jgi:SAM-dependent methyltransferase
LQILDAHLAPGSRILDLGGGPGRYAIELARRGHRVVLSDLSPELLEQARARIASAPEVRDRIESVDEISAEDLSRYADESFDAVSAFGPFYHLVAEHERETLLRSVGLEVVKTVSLRSVAHRIESELNALDPVVRAAVEEVLDSVSTWPEVVANSGHALVIARRPAD